MNDIPTGRHLRRVKAAIRKGFDVCRHRDGPICIRQDDADGIGTQSIFDGRRFVKWQRKEGARVTFGHLACGHPLAALLTDLRLGAKEKRPKLERSDS